MEDLREMLNLLNKLQAKFFPSSRAFWVFLDIQQMIEILLLPPFLECLKITTIVQKYHHRLKPKITHELGFLEKLF